jgi:DNA modification methylase
LLGRHRLLCGDSTSAEIIDLVMAGKKAELCLTDPPYGLGEADTAKNHYVEYDDTPEGLTRLIDGFLPLARAHSVPKCSTLTSKTAR